MMSITAITPTGDRPLAFALCQLWMKNQTRQPDQWLVIDDGNTPSDYLMRPMEYIRRTPQPLEPKPTLLVNLATGIPLIRHEQIIFIEDDEYYAPEYIETMAGALAQHQVAGISHSKYYHLPSGKYLQIGNGSHASLAQTGIRYSFLPEFNPLLRGDTYLDMRIWKQAGPRGFLFRDQIRPLYLGIKGLPGRPGIGAGHGEKLYRAKDADRSILKRWIPRDHGIYLDIAKGTLTQENYKSYFSAKGIFP